MESPSQSVKRKLFSVSSDYSPQDLLFKFADKVTGEGIRIDDMLSVFLKYNQLLQPIVVSIDSDGKCSNNSNAMIS